MSNDIRNIFKKINELSVDNDSTIQLYDSFDIELSDDFVIETGVVGFTNDGIILESDDSMLEFLDLNGIVLETIDRTKDKVYLKKPDGTMSRYLEESEESADELDEGIIGKAAGLALLLAGLWGVNIYQAQQAYNNSPQLQKLMQFHQQAEEAGDKEKMQEIEKRIQTMKTRIDIGKGEVMGTDNKPVDPVYEAEYQGRKVALNKPTRGDVKKFKVYVKKPNGKIVKVNFGDKNMRIKKSNPARRKSFRARHRCENPGPKWKARYWSCKKW